MNKPIFATSQEKEAYNRGLRDGEREGLHKAVLLLQLFNSASTDFLTGRSN